MRLNSDTYFDNLNEHQLISMVKSMGVNPSEMGSNDAMRMHLKSAERTRHLKIWHDNSGIVSHGHILFCVGLLYDSKVFLTSEEFYDKYKESVNIQAIVETPEVYLIGRCKSNDEQLAYIQTREECTKHLKEGFFINETSPVEINDVLRIFCGDGPAAAMEIGHQKGGTYFCISCGVNKAMTDNICHCYHQAIRSYADRIKEVMKGTFGRQHSVIKKTLPFEKLTVNQLRRELVSRNADLSGLKMTKKDLYPYKETL